MNLRFFAIVMAGVCGDALNRYEKSAIITILAKKGAL
jgi:hypothetical protein